MYQWDRIEILETNSICSQMICNKIIRIHNRERIVLSKNDIGNTRYPNTASPSLSLRHITHKTDQT